ncbi:transposase [Desulfoglaeba alkanexedens ALDC]|uniref:Transposase n=1 Tax=Desulfoglaeba alkanexedens ALDC TaxID=980445 RepID=A0A4P8L375_9BACT|nr:transposase [Desulfoglaeba alkanexedens ALDC]
MHSFDSGSALRKGLAASNAFYNHDRAHSALDNRTPDEVYYGVSHPFTEAA